MSKSWTEYHSLTKGNPPRPLLLEALKHVNRRESCLDIGAGALNDSKYLLAEGFKRVVAIDPSPGFLTSAREISSKDFFPINSPVEIYEFAPDEFDLVTAQFSLPFVSSKQNLDKLINAIHSSLKKGGIFCGQLFGVKDSWNDDEHKILFHPREEIETIIGLWETLFFQEEEKDGRTASDEPKHWHIFNFILRKQ